MAHFAKRTRSAVRRFRGRVLARHARRAAAFTRTSGVAARRAVRAHRRAGCAVSALAAFPGDGGEANGVAVVAGRADVTTRRTGRGLKL